MSCGSERLCPWKTTTSRSRQTASIASISACGNGFETSTPSISAPNVASRFLIDIAIGCPSMLPRCLVDYPNAAPAGEEGLQRRGAVAVARSASSAEILGVFGLDLFGRLVLFDRIGGQHLDPQQREAVCRLD